MPPKRKIKDDGGQPAKKAKSVRAGTKLPFEDPCQYLSDKLAELLGNPEAKLVPHIVLAINELQPSTDSKHKDTKTVGFSVQCHPNDGSQDFIRPGRPLLLPLESPNGNWVLFIVQFTEDGRVLAHILDPTEDAFDQNVRDELYLQACTRLKEHGWDRLIPGSPGALRNLLPTEATWVNTGSYSTIETQLCYTVVTAWISAMGLELNTSVMLTGPRLDHFVRDAKYIFRLLGRGLNGFDWKLLLAFFRCYGLVTDNPLLPPMNRQFQGVDYDETLEKQVNEDNILTDLQRRRKKKISPKTIASKITVRIPDPVPSVLPPRPTTMKEVCELLESTLPTPDDVSETLDTEYAVFWRLQKAIRISKPEQLEEIDKDPCAYARRKLAQYADLTSQRSVNIHGLAHSSLHTPGVAVVVPGGGREQDRNYINLAIASVIEPIMGHQGETALGGFALTGEDDNGRIAARPRRVWIKPYTVDETYLGDVPEEAASINLKGSETHAILDVVQEQELEDRRFFAHHIVDSRPDIISDDYRTVIRDVEQEAEDFEWTSHRNGDKHIGFTNSSFSVEQAVEDRFGSHDRWEAGMLAVLNAWIVAMGLTVNPNARDRDNEQFYEQGMALIHRALEGVVDWATIVAFLKCYDLILETGLGQVNPNRQFSSTRVQTDNTDLCLRLENYQRSDNRVAKDYPDDQNDPYDLSNNVRFGASLRYVSNRSPQTSISSSPQPPSSEPPSPEPPSPEPPSPQPPTEPSLPLEGSTSHRSSGKSSTLSRRRASSPKSPTAKSPSQQGQPLEEPTRRRSSGKSLTSSAKRRRSSNVDSTSNGMTQNTKKNGEDPTAPSRRNSNERLLYSDPCRYFHEKVQEKKAEKGVQDSIKTIQSSDTFTTGENKWLLEDEAHLAIASVTMSIVDPENPQNGYSLMSNAIKAEYQMEGIGDFPKIVRSGRPILVPHVEHGHTVLIVIQLDDAGDPTISVIDSMPYHYVRHQRDRIHRAATQILRHSGWSRRISDKPKIPAHATWIQGLRQRDEWSCGYLVIFTAWALAMGLKLNPNAQKGPTFFEDAQDILALARGGYADWQLIFSFLRCHDITSSKDVLTHKRFRGTEGFLTDNELFDYLLDLTGDLEADVDESEPDFVELRDSTRVTLDQGTPHNEKFPSDSWDDRTRFDTVPQLKAWGIFDPTHQTNEELRIDHFNALRGPSPSDFDSRLDKFQNQIPRGKHLKTNQFLNLWHRRFNLGSSGSQIRKSQMEESPCDFVESQMYLMSETYGRFPKELQSRFEPEELGIHLSDEEVMLSMAAVIEAIDVKQRPANGTMAGGLAYIPSFNLPLARSEDDLTELFGKHSLARPRRCWLMPYVVDGEALGEINKLRGESGAIDPNKKMGSLLDQGRGHTFLAVVQEEDIPPSPDVGAKKLFRIYLLDSSPAYFDDMRGRFHESIMNAARNTGWSTHRNPESSTQVQFDPECYMGEVPPQINDWACGIHTVVNAWILAMGLIINHRATYTDQIYREAREMRKFACCGLLDWHTLFAWLRCKKLILDQSWSDVPETRRFERTIFQIDDNALAGRIQTEVAPYDAELGGKSEEEVAYIRNNTTLRPPGNTDDDSDSATDGGGSAYEEDWDSDEALERSYENDYMEWELTSREPLSRERKRERHGAAGARKLSLFIWSDT